MRKVQTAVRAAGLMTGAHVQVGSSSGSSPCGAKLSTSGNSVRFIARRCFHGCLLRICQGKVPPLVQMQTFGSFVTMLGMHSSGQPAVRAFL